MLWCSAGAQRQLQSFAILLLPEAKEGLMEGPSLVLSLQTPHPGKSPTRLLLHPTASTPPNQLL